MKTRVPPKTQPADSARTTAREKFVFTAKELVKKKEHEFMLSPAGLNRELVFELTSLCLTLHDLAQKYVPNTPKSFTDFDAFLQASRKLRGFGLHITLDARVAAAVKSTDNSAVKSSFEYRVLRNKFIAALATIADLTTKSSPFGEAAETGYQRGVREGYRRASEIAILFLEDIQNGVH